MKLTLAALTILFASLIPSAQAKTCLPIGFDNNARIQAVLESDLVTELQPLLGFEIPEDRVVNYQLSSVNIHREGKESVVRLEYTINLKNPEEEIVVSYPFSVEQTCDGKLKVSFKRWGTPAR
jgi:hypothetical protein